MHVILSGATGTVGWPTLQRCLATPAITRLTILSRRQFDLPTPPTLDTSKARIIVHEDYTTYPESLLSKLRGAEACIWAQGISQTEVNKDAYVRITHDSPLAAARAFAGLSDTGKFNFVYVSGEGADETEKSSTLFARVKGRAENALIALPKELFALRTFNVRAGGVFPRAKRPQHSFMRRVLVENTTAPLLAGVIRVLIPSLYCPTPELSAVLVDLAIGDGSPLPAGPGIQADGHTIRNSAIRARAKDLGAVSQ
ncbi:hypothetical protein FISHEDRAFT_32388 [Fistulina hepatica ATCC 64428]|uniref:NAD(P)-binding domain-containing protein n=1 Tax=Fistulina hepatica ATCC 64428 TaxID=1128425 RepID=A0A0D7AQ58_9AGAR|nr:hypothetical protein FISHEDRAFT_32388 [Fistulina hepatica ATCC 64428]